MAIFTLFVTCTRFPNTNPFDPANQGNYAFSVFWSALPATHYANVLYAIPFTASGGNDYFIDVKLTEIVTVVTK